MTYQNLSTITIAFLLSLINISTAQASPLSNFYIRQALDRYFVLPQDAETLSMGGSTGANCRNSNCIYMNPAGLGTLPNSELSLTLGLSSVTGEDFIEAKHLEQNEYRGNIIAAIALGEKTRKGTKYGSLALAYSRYDGHTDDSINTTPDGHRRSIAFGISPLDEISLGYSFTFYDDQLRSQLADLHSHSRLLHIWGLQLHLDENLELGSLFRLGVGQSDTEDFRFSSNGLSHLRSYTGIIGVGYNFLHLKSNLSFDYSRVESRGELEGVALPVVIGGEEEGNLYNIRLGIEKPVTNRFTFRTGLRWENIESYEFKRPDLRELSGSISGFAYSTGLGYVILTKNSLPKLTIDYGVDYIDIGQGAWQQLVTLSWR